MPSFDLCSDTCCRAASAVRRMLAQWRVLLAFVPALLLLPVAGAFAAGPVPLLVLDPRAVAVVVGDAFDAVLAGDAAVGVAVAASPDAGRCTGWQVLRQPGGEAAIVMPRAGSGRFSPDAALLSVGVQAADGPVRVMLVAAGPPQCISVACSLSRRLADRGRLQVDVLALTPAAAPLRCVATNTGGRFRELSAEAVAGVLAEWLREGTELPVLAALPKNAPTAAMADAQEAPAATEAEPLAEVKTEPLAEAKPEATATVPIPRPAPRRQAGRDAAPVGAVAVGAVAGGAAGKGLRALAWAKPGPNEQPGAPEPEVRSPDTPPAVRLQAVAALGEPPLSSELAFEVFAVEEDGGLRLVGQSWAAQPVFELPAGDYVARVAFGGVVRERRFHSTAEGLEQRTLPLDIGYVVLAAVATPGTPPLVSDLLYTLRRQGGGRLIERRDSQPVVPVPAGEYVLSVESGAAKASVTVAIAPGKTVRQVFDLGLGYLRLIAEGEGPVTFQVLAGDGAGPELLAELTVAGGPAPLLRLPAGQHLVTAERAGQTVRQTVTVVAGEMSQLTLTPQAAQAGANPGRL